jgi:hypothetical protein
MDNDYDFTAGIDGFEDFDEIYASIFGEQEALRKQEITSEPEQEHEDIPMEESVPETTAGSDETVPSAEADNTISAEDIPPEENKPVALSSPDDEKSEEDLEFDARFHLDRNQENKRKSFSYNGRRVSSTQELHYEPKQPEYEELQSSYTAQDSFDALFNDQQDEEADSNPRPKRFPFFHRKLKDLTPEPTEPAETDNTDTAEPVTPKRFFLFRKPAGDPDEDDLNEGLIPSSFGKRLTARIAGLVLLIRGNFPAGNDKEIMDEDGEDLGQELSPMAASKYYGSQIYSLRVRVRLSLLMLALIIYLTLGLPIPGMLQSFRVAVAACMALQFTIMVLSLDVVTNGILNLFRRKAGADTMAVLSCLLTALDGMAVLGAENVYRHMPLFAVSSLSLFGILFSSLLSARGLRKALRVPAIGKQVYTVTAETNVTGQDVTILKSSRPVIGFVRRMEEAPFDESVYRKLAPLIFLAALVLSVFTAIIKRSPSNILYIFSSIFSSSVPFTALLGFALPFFVGTQRIFSSGAAVAGWSGVSDIGLSKNLIVTDRDLFPAENIEIESVRIFADYDSDKVISYAGSMILSSKCGLAPSFSALMDENKCPAVRIDNLEYLAGGGIKGMAEGHILICGGSDLMRLMNVRVPNRLVSKTSVLLSIDGVLYGIFNIKYTPDPKVRRALVSLMRSNRHPIFAIRDFNITPEFIYECFDVATDGYDFPPYVDRFPISEAKPSIDSQIAAVVCREGLGPLTDVADTGRSIFVVTRINTLITLASSVLGLLVTFFKLVVSGSITPGGTLLMMLLFALPVFILGILTTSVN